MGARIKGAGGQGVTGSGTVDQIPIWTGISQLGNSVLRQVGSAVIVGATDPSAAAAETLRTVGGIISDTGAGHDNVRIGRAALPGAFANARNVLVGALITANVGPGASENVVLGYGVGIGSGQGSSVVVGANISWPTNTAGPAVLIGSGIIASFPGVAIGIGCTPNGSGVLVGNQATTSAVNNYVGVGRGCHCDAASVTVVGDNARGTHATCVVLGKDAVSLAANMLVIGATNSGIATVLIGEGDTLAAYVGITYRHTNGTGANDIGGNVTFVAPLGTGNAVGGGRIIFQTGATGGAGAALQAATSRLEIREAVAGGASVNFIATNSPGAAVGTLTNAPTAGNPEWVPVLFNGNIRFMPLWP